MKNIKITKENNSDGLIENYIPSSAIKKICKRQNEINIYLFADTLEKPIFLLMGSEHYAENFINLIFDDKVRPIDLAWPNWVELIYTGNYYKICPPFDK